MHQLSFMVSTRTKCTRKEWSYTFITRIRVRTKQQRKATKKKIRTRHIRRANISKSTQRKANHIGIRVREITAHNNGRAELKKMTNAEKDPLFDGVGCQHQYFLSLIQQHLCTAQRTREYTQHSTAHIRISDHEAEISNSFFGEIR